MLYGGLPPIMNISSSEEKINFLKALFEETYISDIVGRHNVRNRAELEELLKSVIISSRPMRFQTRQRWNRSSVP